MLSFLDLEDSEQIRRCLRDVVALSTLPAIWAGADPLRIAESLAAALFTTLNPRFVCLICTDTGGRPTIRVAQTGRYTTDPELAGELAPKLMQWARSCDPDELMPLPGGGEAGGSCVSLRPVGHHAELGVVAAAFGDEGPTASQKLLLTIGAGQAATALQNARLLASLREEGQTLETLNRTGRTLAGKLDLEAIVQAVTDAGVQLTGGEFGAFFYTAVSEQGELFTLYTLSGADRAAFERFPHPRSTAVFEPTFKGEAVVRSPDITADPRFGRNPPYNGMPEGHLPVRSYLAVPVKSRSGEVLGGLFFGHSEVGRFTERAERVMVGLAAQTAIAIDNVRLFQDVQRANQTLEERVAARTSELEHAHAALRQAQKMEAIGQLTGGIAHDFNNLLTVIRGSADLLRRDDLPDEKRRRYIASISETADRAARLTSQLLAFARRQALAPEPFDAAARVQDVADMLRTVLGSRVRLEIEVGPEACFVEADPAQFETALVNLAVNARDAMDGEGRLHVAVGVRDSAPTGDAGAGGLGYVGIAVSDSGHGIRPEIADRIFEPFFTTKEVGKGTGLGLSQVYGFAQQSGGTIDVASEPGKGATFTLYLPRTGARRAEEVPRAAAPGRSSVRGTVLLVEDNLEVSRFAEQLLLDLGFKVVAAHSGMQALARLENGHRFDVVFSDVVMPGMSGVEFGRQVRARWPGLPVVLTSGYSHVLAEGPDHGFPLLHKPYSADGLAEALQAALAGNG